MGSKHDHLSEVERAEMLIEELTEDFRKEAARKKSDRKTPESANDVHEFSTGAVRSTDADHVRYDLISPIALDEIAMTYAEGAAKYGDHNWLKGMPVSDLLNHALRHVYLFLSGDRSEPHLPHAAWGLMAAIHSHKMWPHLNGNLLGEGCTPPGKDGEKVKTWAEHKAEASSDFCDPSKWAISEGSSASLPGGQDPDLPLGCWRNEKGQICGIVEDEPSQPRDEWREFCDYMGWSPDAPFDPSNARKPLHDIPAIDDALNGRGPFPVLYLSGPMSGYRDLNFPAFNRAAEELRRRGFPVLNPADFGAHAATTWEDNLHRDLNVLGFADILVQLPGWECSRGASLEFSTAVALGKGVTSADSLISFPCKSSNEDFSKNARPGH